MFFKIIFIAVEALTFVYTISALLIQKSIVIFEEAGGERMPISVLKLEIFFKNFLCRGWSFYRKTCKMFLWSDRNMSRKKQVNDLLQNFI